MIYFLYGDNDFLIDRRTSEIKAELAIDSSMINDLDCNQLSTMEIEAQLVSSNLFSERQLFIIRGVTASSELWSKLETTIDMIPDSNSIILTHVKALSKVNNVGITRTLKKLKAVGVVEKFDQPKNRSLDQWLSDEADRRRLKLNRACLQRLIELTAGDDSAQHRLSSELDKLQLLGNEITIEAINKYVDPSPVANAFHILEKALKGDVAGMRRSLASLSEVGEDPHKFMGLLTAQAVALSATILKVPDTVTPFQLAQAQNLLNNLHWGGEAGSRMQHVATVLADLDYKLKTSKSDEAWMLIEINLGTISFC